MKTTGLTGLAIVLGAAAVFAGEGWQTDFEKAKQEAARTQRPILANFSGSDWCGWCIKLDQEVFSQPEFKAFADSAMVLFLADFPRRKEVPPALKTQNDALLKTYPVKGFPTVLLLDASGKVLAQTGYRKGGAPAYVEHLKTLLPKPEETPAPPPATPALAAPAAGTLP